MDTTSFDSDAECSGPELDFSAGSISDGSVQTEPNIAPTIPLVSHKKDMDELEEYLFKNGSWQQRFQLGHVVYQQHTMLPPDFTGPPQDDRTHSIIRSCHYSPISDDEYIPLLQCAGQWAYMHSSKLGRNSHSDRRTNVNELAKISLDHSPPSNTRTKTLTSSILDATMREPSPGPEPDLVSDLATIDGTTTGLQVPVDDDDLQSLAVEVFRFWPEGVALYTHTSTSGQTSKSGQGHVPYKSSSKASHKTNHLSGKAHQPSKPGQTSKNDRGAKLAIAVEQDEKKSVLVTVWRCLHEASRGDESCDSCNFEDFYSMKRHVKEHHSDEYPAGHFNHCERGVALIYKQSTDAAREQFSAALFVALYPGLPLPYLRFDRLSSGPRRPYAPPALPSAPLPIAEAPPVLQRPASPASSLHSSRTIEGSPPQSSQHRPASAGRVAAQAFTAALRSDPYFATEVREVCTELRAIEQSAESDRQSLDSKCRIKRKAIEIDDEDCDEDSKIRRLDQVDEWRHSEEDKIKIKLTIASQRAKGHMRRLYNTRHSGESSSQPLQRYSLPTDSAPKTTDATPLRASNVEPVAVAGAPSGTMPPDNFEDAHLHVGNPAAHNDFDDAFAEYDGPQ